MSSEIVFFSSSSRSTRSTNARRCSLATRAGTERASAAPGAMSVIDVLRSSGRGAICHAPRFRRKRSGVKPNAEPSTASVFVAGRVERGALLRARLALVFRPPFLVRHAVDELAALLLRHRHALGVGCFLHPVGQAVAAELREVH